MRSHEHHQVTVNGGTDESSPQFLDLMQSVRRELHQHAADIAINYIQDALQQPQWTSTQRAMFIVTLGQIIASMGNIALATETLLASTDLPSTSSAAAHILCHYASAQIAQGDYSDALSKVLRAYELSQSDVVAQMHIRALFTTLVPLVAIRQPESYLVQEQAVFGIWRMLIDQLRREPDNILLLHTMAIWGQQMGARLAQNEAQHPEALAQLKFRADEAWSCAITSWFALTANPQMWNTYIAHLDEQRHAITISSVASEDLRLETITRLQQQIETTYEYQFDNELMRTWHDIAPLLYTRLIFHREQQSAEALATIAARAPHILAEVQFPGAVAGIGFLHFIGLADYLNRIVLYIDTHEVAPQIKEAGMQLKRCTSALVIGYLLQELGLLDEAILFCRSFSQPRSDVRELLAQFLLEKARGLLHSDQFDAAEVLCREILHGRYMRDDATCQAIFVEIIKNRISKHLTQHPNDFDGALHIARDARYLLPDNFDLKRRTTELYSEQILRKIEVIGVRQSLSQSVVEIANLIDDAWTIARAVHEDDLTWLITTYRRIVGKLLETNSQPLPQENSALALMLLQRAFKHAPNHSALLAMKAVVLRLQAVALVVTSGLDNGKIPSQPTQKHILQLMNESWVLDHSEAQIADVFASVCMQFKLYDSATYFTDAALVCDPTLKTARERQKLLHIMPVYERALKSFNTGVDHVNQQNHTKGLLAFTYAIHILDDYIGRGWDFIDELWEKARENAKILRRAGY